MNFLEVKRDLRGKKGILEGNKKWNFEGKKEFEAGNKFFFLNLGVLVKNLWFFWVKKENSLEKFLIFLGGENSRIWGGKFQILSQKKKQKKNLNLGMKKIEFWGKNLEFWEKKN